MKVPVSYLLLSTLALAVPIDTSPVDNTVACIDTPKHIKADCDPKDPKCPFENRVLLHTATEFGWHLGIQSDNIANAAGNVLKIEGQKDAGNSVQKNGKTIDKDLGDLMPPHSRPNERDAPSPATVPETIAGKVLSVKGGTMDQTPAGVKGEAADESEKVEGEDSHARPKVRGHTDPEQEEEEVAKFSSHETRGNPTVNLVDEEAKHGYPSSEIDTAGKTIQKQGQAAQAVGDGVDAFGDAAEYQFKVWSQGCKNHCDDFFDLIPGQA